MKEVNGWWFPDHEAHMWMNMEVHNVVMNGRLSYQGAKQVKLILLCEQFRSMIDIGAHVGMWSYNMALEFDKVYAFEPMAEHRACFQKNVAGVKNVQLYDCALGETSKMVGMKTTEGNSGDTYVHEDGAIPMRTLDEFNFNEIDAIKMDCQGYESHIIDGAMETIIRNRPVIVVEQKSDTEAVEKLKKVGYSVDRVMNGDYFMTWGKT